MVNFLHLDYIRCMQTETSSKEKIKNKTTLREFRSFLQDKLTERCSRNPNYSLRSFAKSLQISAAALSDMLNGKRPITEKMKMRLGLCLGLSIEELNHYKAKPHGNNKYLAESDPTVVYKPIAIDLFSVISEPYHYGLLELMKTKNFKWDIKWISDRLKITVSEVKIAIDRLQRVGLLEKNERGELVDTTNGFRSDLKEGFSSEGQRRSLIRSHELAIEAVRTLSVQVRDNTTMTMGINKNDLPKARKLIKEFRRRLCVELESHPTLDEVFQLNISFIPLTNIKLSK